MVVKDGILPDPLALKPIAVLLFVQEIVALLGVADKDISSVVTP